MKLAREKKIRVGVIGLGRIALGYDEKSPSRHAATHARAVLHNDKSQLVWGVDPVVAAKKRWIKLTDVPAFGNLKEINECEDPDLVIIATPSHTHAKVFASVAKYFPQCRVLIEKPLALTSADVRKITTLAQRLKIKMAVNYYLPFDPTLQLMKKRFLSGLFGKFEAGNVTYARGFMNNASHWVDALTWFFGKSPLKVHFEKLRPLADLHDHDASAILVFGGIPVHFQATPRFGANVGEVDLVFEKARLVVTNQFQKISLLVPKPSQKFSGYTEWREQSSAEIDVTNYQSNVFDHLIENWHKPELWQESYKRSQLWIKSLL